MCEHLGIRKLIIKTIKSQLYQCHYMNLEGLNQIIPTSQ